MTPGSLQYEGFCAMPLKEFWIFLLVLVAWFVLNRWVLPRFGVPT